MSSLGDTVATLSLLAEPTRLRLLRLLCDEPLTVAEIVRITELGQSRVSTHVGRLRKAGLVRDRRVGNSTLYDADPTCFPPEVASLWRSLGAQLDDQVFATDARRRDAVVRARRGGRDWPDEVAGHMERHYSPGRTWEATARGLVGLMRLGDVLDIGAGDGAMTALLASRARSITSVDRSLKVVEAARARLGDRDNVSVVHGDMHALPCAGESFDQVLMLHVLTYAEDPAAAVREAARVLRPGGDLVVVTLAAHLHAEVSNAFGHTNDGFSSETLGDLLEHTGLEVSFCDLTSRERRVPYFEIITAFARKPAQQASRAS